MWNQSYMWVSFKLSISCDCLETINYFSNNQVIWSHLEMPSFLMQVLLPLIGKMLVAHQLTISSLAALLSCNSQGSFAKFTACFNLTPALSLPLSPLLASVFWLNKVLQTGYQGVKLPLPTPPPPPRILPQALTQMQTTGVLDPGLHGMVVAGVDRKEFVYEISLRVDPSQCLLGWELGASLHCPASPSPHWSLPLQLGAHMSNTFNQGFILRRGQNPKILSPSFSFGLYLTACGFLAPQPGIKPVPPALGTWSLNHWTSREVPSACLSYCWIKLDLWGESCNFPCTLVILLKL